MRGRREGRLEAKLYRDIDHQDRWIAWSAKIGWVGFHARPNGWAEREPVVELDALRLREVPLAEALYQPAGGLPANGSACRAGEFRLAFQGGNRRLDPSELKVDERNRGVDHPEQVEA